jgi:hypothetical protein
MKGIFYIHYNAPGDNDGAWVFGADGTIDAAFAALAVGDTYEGGILKYAAKWMDVVTTADGTQKLTGQQEATLGSAYGDVGPIYTNQTLSGGGTPDSPLILAQQGAADQQVLKWNNTLLVWEPATDTAGTGDVVGPASSTDEAVARYNLATGKLLQNSSVTITDAGAVAGVTSLAMTAAITGATNGTFTGTVQAATLTATGNVTGTNLSGTNTGDQFTAQAADSLVGRGNGGGAGAAQTITLGAGLAMAGTVLDTVGSGVSKAAYGGGVETGLAPGDFYNPFGVAEGTANALAPFAGTLRNLYIYSTSAAAGVGEIITVYINGVASALTATIAAAAQTANNTADTPAVVAGDRISIGYGAGSDGNVTGLVWGFELRAS